MDEALALTVALAKVDEHLAALAPDRKLLTRDEHVDVLLDIRNALSITTQGDHAS